MAGVKIEKDSLYEGLWKTADLAEVLDISPSTFSNNKEKWMKIIEKHADVEEISRGLYYLSNIR